MKKIQIHLRPFKIRTNAKIFMWITAWLVVSFLFVFLYHMPIMSSLSEKGLVQDVRDSGIQFEAATDKTLRDLERDMDIFSVHLSSGKSFLDEAQTFLNSYSAVKEVHYYRESEKTQNVLRQPGVDQILDPQKIGGLLEAQFFYQALIGELESENMYSFSYKGEGHYLVFVIRMDQLFEPILKNMGGTLGVFDQYGTELVTAGRNFNGRNILQHAEQSKKALGHMDSFYYYVSSAELGGVDLRNLTVFSDQTYRQDLRLYMIRLFLMFSVLFIAGLLVAWRIVKEVQKDQVNMRFSKIPEIKTIKHNMEKAMGHMEAVTESFEDIRVLKEELAELYEELDTTGNQKK